MQPAPDDIGTITLEQWKRRQQLADHAAHSPQPRPPPPEPPTPSPPVKHRSWADELERRARHCRGCGEWVFSDWCDWCIHWTPEPVIPNLTPKPSTKKRPAIHHKSPAETLHPTTKQISDTPVTYPCCEAKRDSIGRKPIGFCGPECARRTERLARK